MNKKISYGCLVFCMALYSVDGFAARRNTTRANTTTKTRSSSLVSGYSDKYFKSPSITLVEKRSVELEPLMFTENIANIKKTLSGSTAIEPKYRLCIPCENIYLTYNDGVINESLKGDSQGEGNCYSLNADTPNEYYKLSVKSGAIEACGDKLRMTILDMRNKDVHTEVDSVVLNLVPNSSLYDYSNIKLGQDTEIYELIENYTNAKKDAIEACNNGIKTHLNAFKKALVGTTVASSLTTVTGGIDTALQTKNTLEAYGKIESSEDKDDDYNKKVQSCFTKVYGSWVETCDEIEDSDKKTKCENFKKECAKDNAHLKGSHNERELAKLEGCQKSCDEDENNKKDDAKMKKCYKKCSAESKSLTGSEIASVALSGASAAGNITTMAISISVAKQVDGLIDDLKACKVAAEKMHTAGMALEAGLEEIMSADE